MTNKHLKTTLIVATVLMSGLGAYRSYSVMERVRNVENELTLKNVIAISECELPRNWICTGDKSKYCKYTNNSTGTVIRCKGSYLHN